MEQINVLSASIMDIAQQTNLLALMLLLKQPEPEKQVKALQLLLEKLTIWQTNPRLPLAKLLK